jgi:LysR family nod box-dependent transcriptional activator
MIPGYTPIIGIDTASNRPMRINRLDLNQLACLDALFTERNVSRAAERLYITQPAASATLARMREYFRDPLLVPYGKELMLTPFARTLIEPVRDLLLQADALTRRRPGEDPMTFERTVSIVGSDYAFTTAIVPMMRRAAVEAPRLEFDVRLLNSSIDEQLRQGGVDMVVSLASGVSPDHPHELLFQDDFSCVAWREHPTLPDALTLETFMALGHVVVVLGQGRVPTLDQLALDEQGLQRQVVRRVPAFAMMPPCLLGTPYIGTLPTRYAHELATRWPLRVLACPVTIAPLVQTVQWHRYQSHDPALCWVRAALRDAAASTGLTAPSTACR